MKKLVQFRFGEKGIQIIENLKQKLDFSSRAEVMRLALNLLNWTIECLKNGYEITAIKGDSKNIEDKPIDKLSILNIIKSGFTPASAGRDAARKHKERMKGSN